MKEIIKQPIFFIGLVNIFNETIRFFIAVFTEKRFIEWVEQANKLSLGILAAAYILSIVYFAFLSEKLTK
jgi:hypothetical protein